MPIARPNASMLRRDREASFFSIVSSTARLPGMSSGFRALSQTKRPLAELHQPVRYVSRTENARPPPVGRCPQRLRTVQGTEKSDIQRMHGRYKVTAMDNSFAPPLRLSGAQHGVRSEEHTSDSSH